MAAKKSDFTLVLTARHTTTQHFAGVPTEGSEGRRPGKEDREVKRIQFYGKRGRRLEQEIFESQGCRGVGYTPQHCA